MHAELEYYLSFFFFSSRRRHTRLQGDWSSDVCSSDLSNVSSLSMLATRRIGRPPQISPYRGGLTTDVQYADMPETSPILGAGKLTGRTPSGWSIGSLDAVTRRETAPVQFTDSTRGSFAV